MDGRVYSLQELIQENYDLEGKIQIKGGYFRVSRKIRKNYAVILLSQNGYGFSNSDVLVTFSDEKRNSCRCLKLTKTGIYSSIFMSKVIGEGIFDIEKQGDNLYKIIYPRK